MCNKLSNKKKKLFFFSLADDDVYIEVDNLRQFLSDKKPDLPVTFGYDFSVFVPNGYNSG
jgi:hypothetical protein